MGISKALMEKLAISKTLNKEHKTVVCITRYGNVLGSRNSIIPVILDKIKKKLPILLTSEDMTRFLMTMDDAINLVLYAFENGNSGEIYVQKSPATTIGILAKALTSLMGVPNHEVKVIGTRHGEKVFESLLSREEMVAAQDLGCYFRLPPDLRDLNYGKFVEQGETQISEAVDYNSHNTTRLDIASMQTLLMNLRFMQATVRGEDVQAEE